MSRSAKINRKTAETQIELELTVDGGGNAQIATGVGFLDHMLTLLAKHAAMDLKVKASGDLQVDQHHTVEDVGICLGKALGEALGDKAGIRRYGHFTLPMEETLVTVAADLGGRTFFVFDAQFPTPKIGQFDSELVADFWQAFSANALSGFEAYKFPPKNKPRSISPFSEACIHPIVSIPALSGSLTPK
jgi:imidazoleglycerol-phosphate dehydratase